LDNQQPSIEGSTTNLERNIIVVRSGRQPN